MGIRRRLSDEERHARTPTKSWREVALAHIDELRTLAAWLATRQGPPEASAESTRLLLDGIGRHLDEAELAATRDARRTRRQRWMAGIDGVDVERAYNHIEATETLILRLAPLSYEQAIMPTLVAIVRRHLPAGDERLQQMEELARSRAPFTQADGDMVAAAVRDAGRQARREIARVRSFRNVIGVTTFVLTVLALGVMAVGLSADDAIPLCFVPDDIAVVCPIREVTIPGGSSSTAAAQEIVLRKATKPGDIPLVQLIGLIAAAVAAAVSLRRIDGTATPFALPVALAVLKLPTGMLTAVLGILLLRGGFVPGLSALDSPAQILAWALVFGYAQQLFTQFVDQQAKSVLADVRGAAETPRA
ncbi:hypothetical protein VSS74_12090 [Conexibacter stalactiti]|uniref:DUF5667 domain-containing protein n=1 Tax=Conexibacter stalactiti TaxID=1940611 RepID=A0ABU4HSP7_9ACTN|nr:hypothetical protein [Conexibacter stalactiti]MDW5595084.1 hypothetical protein [Conexibacter stalactiti]MEC5035726.1 hypothetical protein [Conexibacter stalactiti]